MAKLLVILFIGLIMEAVGVVYLSRGLKQIGEMEKTSAREVARVIKRGINNPSILLGVMFEALFFCTLLYLMSHGTVSFVWPLTALGFVLTTLAAKFVLREYVSPARWAGVLLIMAGAALIIWSEKYIEHPKMTPSVAASTAPSNSPAVTPPSAAPFPAPPPRF